MIIKNNKLSTKSTIFFWVDIAILVSFIALPWLNVSDGFGTNISYGTGLTLPFNLFSFTNAQSRTLLGVAHSVVPLTGPALSSFLLYIGPLLIGIALILLLKEVDGEDEFDYFSIVGYVICAIDLVIFFIISSLVNDAIKTEIGYFISTNYSSIQFGFYIMLISVAIGIIAPFCLGASERPNYKIAFTQVWETIKRGFKSTKPSSGMNVRPMTQNPPTPRPNQSSNPFSNVAPIIRLVNNKNNAEVYSLPAVIGRQLREVDVCISDTTLSRKHCEIRLYQGSTVVIRDLGSTYGTVLAGEPLIPNKFYQVNPGDSLQLGNVSYSIEIDQSQLQQKGSNPHFSSSIPPSQSGMQKPTSNLNATQKLPLNSGKPSNPAVIPNNRPVQQPNQRPYPKNPSTPPQINVQKPLNRTVMLDYSGGTTAFPKMLLKGSSGRILIDKTPFIIGSDAEKVDYRLREAGISKQHTKIERIEDKFYITDLNSTNGVKVNRSFIKPSEAVEIKVGNSIGLGSQEFKFEYA